MCSFCHDVTSDQSGLSLDEVPIFVAITSSPHQSRDAVAESIVFSHADIPRVSFTAAVHDLAQARVDLKAID